MGKKVNITKPKSQDRGEDSVKKKHRKCKNLNCKEVLFNNKRSSPNISRRAKENKQPVRVICWS